MNAIPQQSLFGHDVFELDRAIGRIAMRSINRQRVRELIKEARSAKRRLFDRGLYAGSDCWAYEQDYLAKSMDVMEAFWLRNEV